MPFAENPVYPVSAGGGQSQGGAGGYGGDGGLVGALVQTGAALYDSSQDRKLSRENTNKTIEAQKREAELAYQRSMAMWHEQNKYNSPEAQMQRFKDAGLNPHLIYGQGNSGNAGSPPQYMPPDIQYRYQSGRFGEAFGQLLPTLMAVGSWMQNMRATEAGIEKTKTDTERAQQLMEYLTQANPEQLKKLQGEVQLQKGQRSLQEANRSKIVQAIRDLEMEFRQKYGDDLWREYGSNFEDVAGGMPKGAIGGTKAMEFLVAKQKLLQAQSETKLKEAQASWTDFDVTNPQQIMLMVLNGVLGLAGGAMKLPGSARANQSQKARPRERPRGLNRRRMGPNHPDR